LEHSILGEALKKHAKVDKRVYKKINWNSACLPVGRVGTIPISNEKFVTNYILEHYHYFLDRTHVN